MRRQQNLTFKAWREKAGLTQREIAKRMKVSNASVSRVENGQTPFTRDFLEGYALAVGADPLDLQREPDEAERQTRILHTWNEVQASLKKIRYDDEMIEVIDALSQAESGDTASLFYIIHLWKTLPTEVIDFFGVYETLPTKQRKAVLEVCATMRNKSVGSELTRVLFIWQRLEHEQRKVAADILNAAFPVKKKVR